MSLDFVSILVAARWGSVGLMVIVLLMMTYILCLRAVLLMRERRYRKLSARWTPILLEGGARHPNPLPTVPPGERFLLLILWNTLRERNEQDAGICHWMGRVAAVTKIDRLARRLLRRRSVRNKLLAIVTLGQLRDRLEWARLCQIAQSGHPLLSLAATQAIARIDPAKAAETVASLIVRHVNWPAAKVASILEDIGPERASEPLARALLQAPESHWPALIPFLAVCRYSTALPTVRQILRENPLDELIAPCLQVMAKFGDRHDLPLVYRYLTHARWHVRTVAAGCLGKMGRRADQEKLLPLLADPYWWVRYRAAQAIVGLSPQDDQRLRDIQNRLTDRYARDILTQAIAEGLGPGQSGTHLSPTGRMRIGAGR
jgi:HEAT repeats